MSWTVGLLLSALFLLLLVPELLDFSWDKLACVLLSIAGSALLMLLFYRTSVTRVRSAMPIVVFTLLYSATTSIHCSWTAALMLICLLIVMLLLLSVYRNELAVEESFIATLLISIVAAAWYPLFAVYILTVWLMLLFERSLSMRTLLAGAIGAAVVALYALIADFAGWTAIEQQMPETNSLQQMVLIAWTLFFIVWSYLDIGRQVTPVRLLLYFVLLIYLIGILMSTLGLLIDSNLTPQMSAIGTISTFLSLTAAATYCFCKRETVFTGVVFLIFTLFFFTLKVLNIIGIQ